MKKVFLTLALFAGLTVGGYAQVSESVLSANKWYSTDYFDYKDMVLTKTKPANSVSNTSFSANGVLNHCSIVQKDLINPEGLEVKAGTEYCDQQFSYKLTGSVLNIKYPLVDWYYKVKKQSNGDLKLTHISEEEAKK